MSRRGDVVRTLLRGTGQTLMTLGFVLLLFCVYELKFTNLVTAQAQEQLADDLRRSWAAPASADGSTLAAGGTPSPAPTGSPSSGAASSGAASSGAASSGAASSGAASSAPAPPPPPAAAEVGSGFAVLRIPRLGGDWNDEPPVVVEGVSSAHLKRGPGHIPGTALPGEVGNVVLSGHRTTYGAPFARFDELRRGDAVVVETRDTWFTYTVTRTRIVAPTAVEVTWPVPGDRGAEPTRALLTMTTCHPRYSARQRLVVHAELTATDPKTAGAPPALRAAPPEAS